MSKGRRARRRARAERVAAALPHRTPAPPPTERGWTAAADVPAADWDRALQTLRTLPPAPEPEPVATQPLPPDLVYPRPVTVEELTGGKDDTALTAELAARLREIPSCQHCGGRHARACPRVRKMSFHPNGALAAVEFWPAGKWSDDDIIWPEDIDA